MTMSGEEVRLVEVDHLLSTVPFMSAKANPHVTSANVHADDVTISSIDVQGIVTSRPFDQTLLCQK